MAGSAIFTKDESILLLINAGFILEEAQELVSTARSAGRVVGGVLSEEFDITRQDEDRFLISWWTGADEGDVDQS
jgi:hypothetical protein